MSSASVLQALNGKDTYQWHITPRTTVLGVASHALQQSDEQVSDTKVCKSFYIFKSNKNIFVDLYTLSNFQC